MSYDTHSDDAFCMPIGKDLLIINGTDNRRYPDTVVHFQLLSVSVDGEVWHLKRTLDQSTEYAPVYVSFIAEADDAAIDDHFVGSEF